MRPGEIKSHDQCVDAENDPHHRARPTGVGNDQPPSIRVLPQDARRRPCDLLTEQAVTWAEGWLWLRTERLLAQGHLNDVPKRALAKIGIRYDRQPEMRVDDLCGLPGALPGAAVGRGEVIALVSQPFSRAGGLLPAQVREAGIGAEPGIQVAKFSGLRLEEIPGSTSP